MTQARLTELEAVNEILGLLGRRPVNSLSAGDLTPDASFALRTLRFQSRSLQALGWHFNRECSVRYTPDVNGQCELANDIASLDNAKHYGGPCASSDLIMKADTTDGGQMKLYDKLANLRNLDGFVFVGDVWVDQIRLLDFENTPEAFRQYVTVRAGRATQARLISDPTLYRFSLDDEAAALRLLVREETNNTDANFLHENNALRAVARISPLDLLENY